MKCWWRIRGTIGNLWNASDSEIEQFLRLAAQRIQDLKGDGRFKYISVFKNYGVNAGQEFEHPNSQLTATTFVPRRVLYELRAGRDYYQQKERCVFCDIIGAGGTPGTAYRRSCAETMSRSALTLRASPTKPGSFRIRTILRLSGRRSRSRAALRDLATLLNRTLQRIRTMTEEFHLVLHTSPNTLHGSESLGYWKTIDDDYHWHIEILPIMGSKSKSYTFKEVYYSPVSSETAVKRLREAKIDS